MFTWIAIHEEAAQRLLVFRERQQELLALLAEMKETGLMTIRLTDMGADKAEFPLREVDPFTFLANFNRGLRRENRIALWRFLKERWHLRADLPSDFAGIPVVDMRNSWFMPWSAERSPGHVSQLWDLFEEAMKGRAGIRPATFDRCLELRGLGIAYVSFGLFWIRPDEFLSCDAKNLQLAKARGVASAPQDFASYTAWIEAVHAQAPEGFPAFSHEADTKARRRAYAISDEAFARLLDRFRERVPDFQSFADAGQLEGEELAYKRKALALFASQPGIAGARALIAAGQGQALLAEFNKRSGNLANFRSWTTTFGQEDSVTARLLGVLIDVSEQPWTGAETLAPLFDAIQAAGLNPSWDVLAAGLWLLRPEDYFPVKIQEYRKLALELGQALPGGRPTTAAFAAMREFGEAFRDRLAPWGARDWTDVQSFIYVVCPREATPEATTSTTQPIGEPIARVGPLVPYTLEHALKDLFIEEPQLRTILAVLRNKQNLILQGAPGVGKSFVAERIAFALLRAKDRERVKTIQFHQSYGYEDFIQGWRPNEGGGFALRNGHFYEFCRRAEADPERDYVLIIDEINRGNLSRIFGEMMVLLEPDKRGPRFAMPLTYSPDSTFHVPERLHIIGLMNTADRSLAMVDYALRRRFAFVTLEPGFDSPNFEQTLSRWRASAELVASIRARVHELNRMIADDTANLGRAYLIGHSFFVPRAEIADGEAWYRAIIEWEILPLLHEYWVDDPARLARAREILL